MSIKAPVFVVPKYFRWWNRTFNKNNDWTLHGQANPLFILVDSTDSRLERHEQKHWRDMWGGLLVGYFIPYYYYQWKVGYKNNPFEIAAREAENG